MNAAENTERNYDKKGDKTKEGKEMEGTHENGDHADDHQSLEHTWLAPEGDSALNDPTQEQLRRGGTCSPLLPTCTHTGRQMGRVP